MDVNDEALVQLHKACRLLEAGRFVSIPKPRISHIVERHKI